MQPLINKEIIKNNKNNKGAGRQFKLKMELFYKLVEKGLMGNGRNIKGPWLLFHGPIVSMDCYGLLLSVSCNWFRANSL
jgi:hypothetical protein